MIVTEIYNGQGLGNQLACYVTTRVIAMDLGYNFGIMNPQKFKCLDFMNLDFGLSVTGGNGPEGGPPTKLPKDIRYYYNERKILHPKNNSDIRTYDKNLIEIKDGTKIDGIMQDEKYFEHRKEEIKKWLEIKKEYVCLKYSNPNICIINFRGGEYVGKKELFLGSKYWNNAIAHMKKINTTMKFVVVTDDPKTAKKFFPNFEISHDSIGSDYSIINNAYYLILSNSSFAFFPAWLNEKVKTVIAPKYWARHNVSDGYWSCGYNIVKRWIYQDRDGNLSDYDTCVKEFSNYKYNRDEYLDKKIENNFLVVSNYYNDISWLPNYTKNYLVYDQSHESIYPPKIDHKRIIKSKHLGHNIRDYCSFIIEHYENLPEFTIFATGNIFPRHVSKNCFDNLINNKKFTPIEESGKHLVRWPISYISKDGGYNEYNNSWYLKHHPTKYFHTYNDFLKFCFKNPKIPKYIRFATGANYIVPKRNIIKYPKSFYENLRLFVSHTDEKIPGESHIIERAFYSIWKNEYEINENMHAYLGENFKGVKNQFNITNILMNIIIKIINLLWSIYFTIKHIRSKFSALMNYITGRRKFLDLRKKISKSILIKMIIFTNYIKKPFRFIQYNIKKRKWKKTEEIKEYRKNIKIYDIFTYNGEKEILEIRLNILYEDVDQFIIVEAPTTFSGIKKPLYFEEQKEYFSKFLDKIKYFVIDDYPNDKQICAMADKSPNVPKDGPEHWKREFYQKESIKKALVGLRDNDICFIGDVDEIWNPETIIDYSKNDIFKLEQEVYSYYINNHSNEPWAGTLVTKYNNIKNECLNHLRTKGLTKYIYIKNGGWHFTSMGGIEEVRRKLNDSYTSESYNTDRVQKNLEKDFGNRDYLGRKFIFTIDEKKLPKYLLENKNKYKHLFKNKKS